MLRVPAIPVQFKSYLHHLVCVPVRVPVCVCVCVWEVQVFKSSTCGKIVVV